MKEKFIGQDIDKVYKRSQVNITPSTKSTAFSQKVTTDLDWNKEPTFYVKYKPLLLTIGGAGAVGLFIYLIWLNRQKNKENKLLAVKAEKYDSYIKEETKVKKSAFKEMPKEKKRTTNRLNSNRRNAKDNSEYYYRKKKEDFKNNFIRIVPSKRNFLG